MAPEQKNLHVYKALERYQLPLYQKIIALPSQNPTEILIEIDPTQQHPEYSVAAALLFQGEDGKLSGSVEHFHPEGTEFYKVTDGEVIIYSRRSKAAKPKKQILSQGESAIIEHNVLHRAEPVGEFAEVIVFSNPGWTPENHKFIDDFPDTN